MSYTGAPLPVREYGSAAEMQAHAALLRRRTFARQPRAAALAVAEVCEPEVVVTAEPVAEPPPPKPLWTSTHPISAFVRAVSAVSGVSLDEIVGHRRRASYVKARQIAFWLAVRCRRYSLPEIGRRLGGKDHTTVLHGARTVESTIAALKLAVPEDDQEAAAVLWATRWPRYVKAGRP